jgi:hypothetical protein
MTVADVLREVEEIRRIQSDDERAHARADRLWRAVLEAIVSGDDKPAALAAAALKVDELDFARWCA